MLVTSFIFNHLNFRKSNHRRTVSTEASVHSVNESHFSDDILDNLTIGSPVSSCFPAPTTKDTTQKTSKFPSVRRSSEEIIPQPEMKNEGTLIDEEEVHVNKVSDSFNSYINQKMSIISGIVVCVLRLFQS